MNGADAWVFGWSQVISLLNIVTTISIAALTFKNFKRWKIEQVESERLKIASEALSLVYEADFVFARIRNPFSTSSEHDARELDVDESAEEKSARDKHYIVWSRLNKENGYFENLYRITPKVMAHFGKDSRDNMFAPIRARNLILTSSEILHFYLETPCNPSSREEIKNHNEERRKLQGELWTNFSKDAEVDKMLSEFRAFAERTFSPLLKR